MSDLYSIQATRKDGCVVALSVCSIHPDVLYSIHDGPGFALIALHEAVPYGDSAPLSEEISIDDLIDQAWISRSARGFIRSVRASDVRDPLPLGAEEQPDHPYWEKETWLSWKLEIEVSDEQWIAHIQAGDSWRSRAYSPSYSGYASCDPIVPTPEQLTEETEGMFVWVPRECFSTMTPKWAEFPALLELPAYPETYYISQKSIGSPASWIGRPVCVETDYQSVHGTIASVSDEGVLQLAQMTPLSYGLSSAPRNARARAIYPKAKNRLGAKLDYDTILSRIPTMVTSVSQQGAVARFTVCSPPQGAKLTLESESDALDLLLGPDWLRRDFRLREDKSALTESVTQDGVALEMETERRIHQVVPFVANKYIASFVVHDVQLASSLPDLDTLSHAETKAALDAPWPTTIVEITVTDERWVAHLAHPCSARFALRDRALPPPCDPPE